MLRRSLLLAALAALALLFTAGPLDAAALGPPGAVADAALGGLEGDHKWHPSIWAVIPFVVMLLCIAIVPLINEHWWENDRNRGLVSAVLGIPVILFSYSQAGVHPILHVGEEYVSFICLLGSLYMISGGIVITGDLKATPLVNSAFLAAGGVLASFIGTTGAAMLLIRPVLSTNSERKHVLHTVIFFIFLVCNCGGLLTPLGDPPLFLGYLKGVPFTWTFSLTPEWVFIAVALLVVYFVFDTIQYGKEEKKDLELDKVLERPLVVRGAHNFLFLGGVVMSVALTDVFSFPSREGMMLLMVLAGWFTTGTEYRNHNKFSFGPIREVAVVFAGIFSTMIPALAYLNASGESMNITSPKQFFWMTGTLSSFLDNAPTYVSFVSLADGITAWPQELLADTIGFMQGKDAVYGTMAQVQRQLVTMQVPNVDQFAIPQLILRAISLGAVFMGAMTYIGNGPNFMVRAIASEAGIKMPSFFGFMVWSCVFLLPLFFVATLVFL